MVEGYAHLAPEDAKREAVNVLAKGEAEEVLLHSDIK